MERTLKEDDFFDRVEYSNSKGMLDMSSSDSSADFLLIEISQMTTTA